MGPPAAASAIRECIELGADRGILLTARQFSGADTLATSYVLAAAIDAIRKTEPVDVIFFGKQAIDGDTAQVGPGVAARLNLPLLTYAVAIQEINLEQRFTLIRRKTENRDEILKASLPVVLTCEKDIAEIPYASLPDLVASLRFEPEIWNSDQGSQFTSPDFLAPLKKRAISISMDGRGRALDNVFIERLWRSLKYELIYPGDFASGADLFPALDRYFRFYNYRRPHQALGYRTPADLFPHRSTRKRSSP